MSRKTIISQGSIIALAVTMIGLAVASFFNYLLFHSLVELFSIVVAFGIFVLAWNSRDILRNNYLLFLGIAYLFVGLFDLIHTLGYKGMGLMPGGGANLPTQLWIGARYLESLSLLAAVPLALDREMKPQRVFVAFGIISAVLLGTIFFNIFPVCFIGGKGLTPFKIISEYVICVILLGAFFMLHRHRDRFEPVIYRLVAASIWLTIGAELAFTHYVSVFGVSNIVGHFFKFLSFYFIYKALVETGLKQPYQLLFRDLKESERRFRGTFDNAAVGIAHVSLDGRWMRVNQKLCDKLGYSSEELLTMTFQDISHPEDLQRDLPQAELLAGGKMDFYSVEKRYIRKDGHPVWVNLTVSLQRNESGEPRYFIAVIQDISDRKQAEEKLLKLTEELQRSNTELEQFAYIASHDLQAPLRTVSSFVQLLRRRYQDKFDAKGDEFIALIVDGVTHMQRLLMDLLEYSRVGTGKKSPHPVDLGAALDQALQNLKTATDESRAEIKVHALPTVWVDETQMIQLFQNLVGNAVKFRGDRSPVVEIGGERLGDEWVISVGDNGIGIDPQHFSKVFLIFNRLHQQEEYPGTGLGLAVCKKIVEYHGGRIWVESAPGNGSIFFFSLPARKPAAEVPAPAMVS